LISAIQALVSSGNLLEDLASWGDRLIAAALNHEPFEIEPVEFLKPVGSIENKRLEQDPMISAPDTELKAATPSFDPLASSQSSHVLLPGLGGILHARKCAGPM